MPLWVPSRLSKSICGRWSPVADDDVPQGERHLFRSGTPHPKIGAQSEPQPLKDLEFPDWEHGLPKDPPISLPDNPPIIREATEGTIIDLSVPN